LSDATYDIAPSAPEVPDLAQMSSVSDYRAVRDTLVRESAERTPGEPLEAPSPVDATPAETPAPADAGDRDPEGRFKKKNPQTRIDRVVWEREQARQEATTLRQQLASLQHAPAAPPADASADQEPSPEAYGDYTAYVADQARWAARQEVRSLQAQDHRQHVEAQTARAMQDRASAFADRLDAAAERSPELLADIAPEVLSLRPAMSLHRGEQPTGATAIADALLESDAPQLLMRHLTDYPDDLRRIAALHPMLAMREIGRLESRFDAASSGSASTRPLSQARPPIQPVGRASSMPRGPRDASQINSVAEWRANRERLTGAR
jgi:hypothetical protein